MDEILDVLIVSYHGSARGPMAEALMSVLSKGRIRAFSASIFPIDRVHPLAEELISAIGYRKDETLEPLNIFDQWQIRGKQAEYIFCACKEASLLAFGNWPGDPTYIEYRKYEELDEFFGVRTDKVHGRLQPGSLAQQRSTFRRVFEQMTTDIREYVARVLPRENGRVFVPARLPAID